jgi:hypothetical protein
MYEDRYVFNSIIFVCLVAALALAGCSGSTATSSATSEGVVSSLIITDKIETSGNLNAGQLVQMT